jgi:hypothetical protein
VKVWYGFVIGNSGGGGVVFSEDRGTYDIRTGGRIAPFDAILAHELGHSHVGNESLTQLIEMYAYNRARGPGADPTTWSWTRSWTPASAANQDSAAMLDILQLVGLDVTARGYRAVLPLRLPYGSPLSTAVIQAFSAQAPGALRSQVEQKLARVTF